MLKFNQYGSVILSNDSDTRKYDLKPDDNYNIIMEKAGQLVSSIKILSQNLPNTDLHAIKFNLLSSLSLVPEKIEQGLKPNKKIDKVRSLIKATGVLSEIKDYLCLAEELHYCKTKDIISQVDNVSAMLTSGFPAIK